MEKICLFYLYSGKKLIMKLVLVSFVENILYAIGRESQNFNR